MNQEVKAKWLEALRSGQYPQTESYLNNGQGFCCLGVLCEVAVKDGVIDPATEAFDGILSYDEEVSFLPSKVANWAGFDNYNPVVTYKGTQNSLAGFNDDGMPFSEIADIIEEKL